MSIRKRGISLIITIWLATFLSQYLLTGIILLGWTYRWVAYGIKRRLFALSPLVKTSTWKNFIERENNRDKVDYDFPKFLVISGQNNCFNYPIIKGIYSLFCSSYFHFKVGLSAAIFTEIMTFIPCLLWSYAWHIGWHISFNKMYEESAIGSSLGFLGIILFAIIMFYVPLAQARYSLTQDWKSFFGFKLIIKWIFRRPLQLFFLGSGYLISSIIFLFIKTIPTFLTANNPTLEQLTSSQALQFLNDYYFWTGIIALALFFSLKIIAGVIYAGVLVETWHQQSFPSQELHEQEVYLLKKLDIPRKCFQKKTKILTNFFLFSLSLSYRGCLFLLSFLIWFLFSFTPFISEFFHYYPQRGFLNQPLVQIPCFRYVPKSLEQEAHSS